MFFTSGFIQNRGCTELWGKAEELFLQLANSKCKIDTKI